MENEMDEGRVTLKTMLAAFAAQTAEFAQHMEAAEERSDKRFVEIASKIDDSNRQLREWVIALKENADNEHRAMRAERQLQINELNAKVKLLYGIGGTVLLAVLGVAVYLVERIVGLVAK